MDPCARAEAAHCWHRHESEGPPWLSTEMDPPCHSSQPRRKDCCAPVRCRAQPHARAKLLTLADSKKRSLTDQRSARLVQGRDSSWVRSIGQRSSPRSLETPCVSALQAGGRPHRGAQLAGAPRERAATRGWDRGRAAHAAGKGAGRARTAGTRTAAPRRPACGSFPSARSCGRSPGRGRARSTSCGRARA